MSAAHDAGYMPRANPIAPTQRDPESNARGCNTAEEQRHFRWALLSMPAPLARRRGKLVGDGARFPAAGAPGIATASVPQREARADVVVIPLQVHRRGSSDGSASASWIGGTGAEAETLMAGARDHSAPVARDRLSGIWLSDGGWCITCDTLCVWPTSASETCGIREAKWLNERRAGNRSGSRGQASPSLNSAH